MTRQNSLPKILYPELTTQSEPRKRYVNIWQHMAAIHSGKGIVAVEHKTLADAEGEPQSNNYALLARVEVELKN